MYVYIRTKKHIYICFFVQGLDVIGITKNTLTVCIRACVRCKYRERIFINDVSTLQN